MNHWRSRSESHMINNTKKHPSQSHHNRTSSSHLLLNQSLTSPSSVNDSVCTLSNPSSETSVHYDRLQLQTIEINQSIRVCSISPSPPTPKQKHRDTILSLLDELQSRKADYNDHNPFLNSKGFKLIQKMVQTPQGEIFEAINISTNQTVSIKIINQSFSECSQNIVKEAAVQCHLTVDHRPPFNAIPQFLALFESPSSYYVVTQFAGYLTLKEFVSRAHQYIAEHRLSFKQWKRIVKLVFWQIVVTVYWLHHTMKCCHLSLTLDNIMITGQAFIFNDETGLVKVNPQIEIRLINFRCINFADIDIVEDEFDGSILTRINKMDEARKSDMWQLGVMLYFMSTGIPPFQSQNDDFKDKKMIHLLNGMMHTVKADRFDIVQVLQHKWLRKHYARYQQAYQKN